MSLAAVNGNPATSLRASVPRWGCWWVDVDLVGEVALTGSATVTLADLTMAGTIVSGGVADGRSAYRIAGGKGGWGKVLAKKAYNDDSGVKRATVLRDAATAAGETIDGLPTSRMGPHFARRDGVASAVLNLVAPRAWRVGFDGVTRMGAYPDSVYAGDGVRTRRAPGTQVIDVVTDKLAALVPGVTVDGSLPATDVEYELSEDRLTAHVYAGRYANRRLSALARQVEALFPDIKYRGTFEYRVVSQQGDRLNLQVARVASDMPDLSRVPVRPGMAGLKATVKPGELVLVVFADADPSRPQVVSHDAVDAPGWMPLTLELGGPGALGIVRLGDAVQAGPFAGVTTFASARIKASL